MGAAESEEVQRLRRELRALGAVNRGLHAQLDSGRVRGAHRRLRPASDWLQQLELERSGNPALVQAKTRGIYVVEGSMCRHVKAGVIAAALARVLGPPRAITDAELEQWKEGPPVEVMEAQAGPAFIVVGGRRLPLRGLPLSFFVTTAEMMAFPEGEELVVGPGRPARPGRAARVRTLFRNEGPVRASIKLAGRVTRRLSRSRSRGRK